MTPRERLNHLANVVLPEVKRSEFDISYWDCGTTACAVGHAARDPVLKHEGLYVSGCPIFPLNGPIRTLGYAAVGEFFGMDRADAIYLFSPTEYDQVTKPGPMDVAARIHQYMVEHPE